MVVQRSVFDGLTAALIPAMYGNATPSRRASYSWISSEFDNAANVNFVDVKVIYK
jgi:hypothetical protein